MKQYIQLNCLPALAVLMLLIFSAVNEYTWAQNADRLIHVAQTNQTDTVKRNTRSLKEIFSKAAKGWESAIPVDDLYR